MNLMTIQRSVYMCAYSICEKKVCSQIRTPKLRVNVQKVLLLSAIIYDAIIVGFYSPALCTYLLFNRARRTN